MSVTVGSISFPSIVHPSACVQMPATKKGTFPGRNAPPTTDESLIAMARTPSGMRVAVFEPLGQIAGPIASPTALPLPFTSLTKLPASSGVHPLDGAQRNPVKLTRVD